MIKIKLIFIIFSFFLLTSCDPDVVSCGEGTILAEGQCIPIKNDDNTNDNINDSTSDDTDDNTNYNPRESWININKSNFDLYLDIETDSSVSMFFYTDNTSYITVSSVNRGDHVFKDLYIRITIKSEYGNSKCSYFEEKSISHIISSPNHYFTNTFVSTDYCFDNLRRQQFFYHRNVSFEVEFVSGFVKE